MACLDGSLATYDLRYPSIVPSLAMKGHVNQWELGLGFDIWKDEFLAAGIYFDTASFQFKLNAFADLSFNE